MRFGWKEMARRLATAIMLFSVVPLIFMGGILGKAVCTAFVGVMAAELALINRTSRAERQKQKNSADGINGRIDGLGALAIATIIVAIIAPAVLVAGEVRLLGIHTTAPLFVVFAAGLGLAVAACFLRHWSALVMAALLMLLLLTTVLLLEVPRGGAFMVLVIGSIALVDTMGYLVGRLVGGVRLLPQVSPAKTWSGACAGLLVSPLPLAVYGSFYGEGWLMAVMGLAVGVSAIGGDLLESWFKRCHLIKDASQILPGHGGILDRLDGYLLAVPVFYGLLWLM